MKVYEWPEFGVQDRGEGGIRRVVEALHRWLPEYGVEVVNSIDQADLINTHADDYATSLPTAASLHGLYWQGYDWANWCFEANQRLIGVAKRAQAVSVPSRWVANAMRRGMLIEPFVLLHGIELDEWEPSESNGYIFWGKTRPDPICDPTPMRRLASRSPLHRFVSTFGETADNIQITGKLDQLETRRYLKGASVYLATVRETGGITVLEAMASAVPVLGFDYGVNPELIVHKETGYLVDPDDYDGLQEGLEYCIANRKRLGEAAREYVRTNHQWKDRIADYIPFFEAALNANTCPVKVSVVVTAYKLEDYLPACLDSILAQDMDAWECVVVDDASPDHCGEIADEYASRDPRFRVIHNEKNRYLAESRNVGMRSARGEFMLGLDADDQLSPSTLRVLSGALDRDPNLDIATGGFELVEPDGRHWTSGWPSDNPNFEEQIGHRNQIPYSSLFRRWVWERTGGYRRRHRTAEDADFWTRAMSFGARPAKVTDIPTLIYANRPGSMSREVPMVDWTAWFPWSKLKELTPFGAAGSSQNIFYASHVDAYGPADVTVVIPCGPDHDFYLQDVLDSLAGQTFTAWEVIVVNDTGRTWFDKSGKLINPYLSGFPYVRVVEPADLKNRGVSWARNAGIRASNTPLFALFDADDYMQPLFLDVLIKTYDIYGGWVYSDWFDQEGQTKEAKPWHAAQLVDKMLGPMTGLYRKADWELVGGFDEQGPGWEDWNFQLSLLEHGICGSRVALPLFTYRYQTGTRRENNFSNAKEILQYIKNRHVRLFEDEEFVMACGICGGGGGQPSVAVGAGLVPPDESMVMIEYVGTAEQRMTLRSRVNPRRQYRFGGPAGAADRKFYVYAGDAEFFTNSRDYKKVEMSSSTVRVPAEVVAPLPATTMERSPNDEPLSSLPLQPEVKTILENAGLATVGQLKNLSLTDLVALRGMGKARARRVQDALVAHS
jgi:glycosyltransferase involved in cell wall biosynthesis